MKKISRIVVVLIILSLFLTACSNKNAFVGKWELVRGDGTYYFYAADVVEFFSDGTVIEYDYREIGTWKVISKDRLQVIDEDGAVRLFDYQINNGRLTLIDEDGDTDMYTKAR